MCVMLARYCSKRMENMKMIIVNSVKPMKLRNTTLLNLIAQNLTNNTTHGSFRPECPFNIQIPTHTGIRQDVKFS